MQQSWFGSFGVQGTAESQIAAKKTCKNEIEKSSPKIRLYDRFRIVKADF